MIVYKQYTQQQLDDQYNTRLSVPDYAGYFEKWELQSKNAATKYPLIKDVAFGEDDKERMDIFPSLKPSSKTIVFIHGGYWHLLDKSMFHFLADHFSQYNITTVLINYPLAPTVSVNEIVSACKRSIKWLYEHIAQFNGDPSKLYIIGHSAGGHLASMLMVEKEFDYLKGIISLSGLFRLDPIRLAYINEAVKMDAETAATNSPVLLQPVIDCPLLLATGVDESDEFKVQSEDLYNSWKTHSSKIELVTAPGKNHYSILDAVVEKNNPVHDSVLRLMNL